jgi:hypothetical protein
MRPQASRGSPAGSQRTPFNRTGRWVTPRAIPGKPSIPAAASGGSQRISKASQTMARPISVPRTPSTRSVVSSEKTARKPSPRAW